MSKIKLIDIETSPNIAHVWGLWKQNVGLSQLMDSSRTMCFAVKNLGERKVDFFREYGEDNSEVVEAAWEALDEAEIIIHYNGKKFDIPTLNKEFLLYGYPPPSPYKQIDLLETAKKQFRFPSNKLDYVAKALGLKGKVKHVGHELWVKCMAGDEKAWKDMEKYNKQDVKLLEDVYQELRPWITNHPNLALYLEEDEMACPNCGGTHLVKRGVQHTRTQTYQRYHCEDCGTWSRGRYTMSSVEKRKNTLIQVGD